MKTFFLAGALALLLPTISNAGDISIVDPYARSSNAKAGAAFMVISNTGSADTLINVTSDAARRVELHTHVEKDGVMRMTELEAGIPLPEGKTVHLKRGGMHVMLMGLKRPLVDGEVIKITMDFETAPSITIEIPVDQSRKPKPHHGMKHNHGT